MTTRGFANLSVPPLPSFSERDALKIPPALSETPGYKIQPTHHPDGFKRSLNISSIGITVASRAPWGLNRQARAKALSCAQREKLSYRQPVRSHGYSWQARYCRKWKATIRGGFPLTRFRS